MVGGYVLAVIGDVVAYSASSSLVEKLEKIIDLVATVATGIIPLLGQWNGDPVSPAWYGAVKVLMGIMAAAETVLSVLNGGSWWQKVGADLMGAALTEGAGGPMALILTGVEMFLGPLLGNLIDIGAHVLLSKGFADFEQYRQEEDMPIQNWCTQYGGCPANAS